MPIRPAFLSYMTRSLRTFCFLEELLQFLQIRAGLIQSPGQLRKVDLYLAQFSRHMDGLCIKGGCHLLIAGPERGQRLLHPGDGVLLQICRPFAGLTFDGSQALPELGISLSIRTQAFSLRPQVIRFLADSSSCRAARSLLSSPDKASRSRARASAFSRSSFSLRSNSATRARRDSVSCRRASFFCHSCSWAWAVSRAVRSI